MESTSTYWKGVYYLLETEGFDYWLVNAREVKNVPGRAKTDRADAVWLAKVVERGMCRPSLVQPPEIRRLRDLTRYRRALVQDRTREQQRVEKLLEEAQIKISSVLSDLHGVSGRAMMHALIAGERDPRTLARLAKSGARKKTDQLEEALRGFFTDHHATILTMMLDNSDRIGAQIAALDALIEDAISPFSRQATRLADIVGVNTVAAAELIAETGVDMTRFPSAAHLVSWAKFCPQTQAPLTRMPLHTNALRLRAFDGDVPPAPTGSTTRSVVGSSSLRMTPRRVSTTGRCRSPSRPPESCWGSASRPG